MIHITKAKGGYMVVTLGQKREVLATSEILKTKQSAFENVYSQAYFFDFNRVHAFAQDDTGELPVIYFLNKKGKKFSKTKVDSVTVSEMFRVKIEKYKPNK